MSVRVLVNGALGRMGQCAVAALQASEDCTLAGTTGKQDDLVAAIADHKPQVVLDLTVASAVKENTRVIIEQGVHPVIGTSGLLADDVLALRELCDAKQLGGLIVPNFSIAAVVLMQTARKLAKFMPHAEIIEMHHTGKQDAPSGTAIRTAEMMADARSDATPPCMHEKIPHARGAVYQQIPIHAVRIPGVLAEQQVVLGAEGETARLIHSTLSRESFVAGMLLACKEVVRLTTLQVGLESVIED